MILPNMSYQEIATHLSSDMDEALAFSKKNKVCPVPERSY